MGIKNKHPKTLDDDDRNHLLLMVVDNSSTCSPTSTSSSPSVSLSSSKSSSLSMLVANSGGSNNNNSSNSNDNDNNSKKDETPLNNSNRRKGGGATMMSAAQSSVLDNNIPIVGDADGDGNGDHHTDQPMEHLNGGIDIDSVLLSKKKKKKKKKPVTRKLTMEGQHCNHYHHDDHQLTSIISICKDDEDDVDGDGGGGCGCNGGGEDGIDAYGLDSFLDVGDGMNTKHQQINPSKHLSVKAASNTEPRLQPSSKLSNRITTKATSATTATTIKMDPIDSGLNPEFPLTVSNNYQGQPLRSKKQQQQQHRSIRMDTDGSFTNDILSPDDILNNGNGINNSDGDCVVSFGKEEKSSMVLADKHQHSPSMDASEESDESSSGKPIVNDQPMERGQWSGKLDFIFSCISYAVGLGNVWRFPYLCYENGGGAFLVPYLLCIFIIGVPLFVMEVSLGQYFHAGGVSIWNQIPIFKGVGFASMIMIGLCNTYYIVIIAWTLYYLFNSLKIPLPWMDCGHEWNSEACYVGDDAQATPDGSVSPAQEFWTRKALNITGDMADVGEMQWHLFATLIVAWILVYGVIYKGIHQSGKIIWVMAIFPYVVLTILFGYGITLPGALDGIRFYITPKWYMLAEAKIWVAAGSQLLFTYGIGIGTNIALGSYNPTHHNFYRDSFIACLLSSFTSLFSGFVIFSVLGHMAWTMNTNVEQVARSGPGLAFIVYPEAVTRLPMPNVWSILFFIMLLVLGIDSQFCTVESFITGIVDEWPHLLRPHRKLFTFFVICVHFLLGLSMITSGGMYVFQLMDNFSASGIALIVVVLFELVAFSWIYGAKRIYNNMVEMLNFKPCSILYILWMYISPLCLFSILIFSIVDYHPPEYAGRPFPWYGTLMGWCIASASLVFIPGYVVYYLFWKADKNLSLAKRFLNGFKPLDGDGSRTKADNNDDNNVLNNNDDVSIKSIE